MAKIHNILNQRIIVCLEDGRCIGLLAGGFEEISDKDITSPHLQALLAKGEILISEINSKQKGESENTIKEEPVKDVQTKTDEDPKPETPKAETQTGPAKTKGKNTSGASNKNNTKPK